MQYKSITQKEANEARLLPKGDYDFEITKAEQKTSKIKPPATEGRPMLAITHRIFVGESFRLLTSYFMLDDDRFGQLRNICEALGILDKYEAGTLEPADFDQGCGKLKLGVKHNDFKGEDENKVSRYIVPKVAAPATRQPDDAAPPADDDVPF